MRTQGSIGTFSAVSICLSIHLSAWKEKEGKWKKKDDGLLKNIFECELAIQYGIDESSSYIYGEREEQTDILDIKKRWKLGRGLEAFLFAVSLYLIK